MAKKSKGKIFHSPYNEVANRDPNSPDISGAGLYVSYDEVIAAQLSQDDADMYCTPNSDSGHGLMGGPAKGELNPAGMSTENEE